MSTTHMASGARPFDEKSGPMSALLARNWWAVLLRGVAAIVFGFAALLLPHITLAALVLVFAIYMFTDGVLTIISAVRAAARRERWGMLVLEGLVDLAAGAGAFLVPVAALLVFVVLAAAWAVITGVLMFVSAFRLQREHGRAWLIIGGAASVIWGVLLALFPATGLVVLTWWLGAYALVFGVTLMALSFRLRQRHLGRPDAAQPA
jgi:uncharacterized membrane protein HdeD (DUF308 family)